MVIGLLVSALFVSSPAVAQDKNVVVHIGKFSEDLHSVTMGLSLANMLQKEGAQVTVFLDREGVRLADQTQKALAYADSDAESLYEEFVDEGGEVVVCPHCAELAGVEESQLRDGSMFGTSDSIASMFMDADLVIDY